MAARKKKELTPQQGVEKVLAEREKSRTIYFPVRHFSPVCAWHLKKLIHEVQPVGVLVEGPEDATELIEYMVHEDTRAPFTIFSSYVDKKNLFGLNGTLSPSEDVPARYRGWWPMTEYCPEYVALKEGAAVGAKLGFIDIPLPGTIPFNHVPRQEINQVVEDRHLAESQYFDALRRGQRRRSFDEFWNANFEVAGFSSDTDQFMKAVLLFAWCARFAGVDPNAEDPYAALEADGTLAREAHMKYCLDAFLKENPEGTVIVVTGAFHSVALPTTKKKKAKYKKDANLETLLTSHSYHALAHLYSLNRLPNYGQVVWDQMQGQIEQPFNAAALQLAIQVMRDARSHDEGVSTADAVGTYKAALNLATLRGNGEVTLEDLGDAVQMGYVKGDRRIKGTVIEKSTREILIGTRLGRVTSAAGQAPLIRDYYEQCRAYKLDITGVSKTVRCDIHKQEAHRLKSAFLHQANHLSVPMFGVLDSGGWNSTYSHYKGPDLVTGENMHLIGETWAVRWQEKVDDRLLELSDRGSGVAAAAGDLLKEQLIAAQGNAEDTTRLLLKCAQMMLLDLFDDVLDAVEDAIVVDAAFDHLVKALSDFVVLHTYRDALATQGHARMLNTIVTVYNRALGVLPGIANADSSGANDQTKLLLDRLQSLVRISLTFEGTDLDRVHLIERIHEMVGDPDGAPILRGAGFGILFSFGATREKVVTRELSGYLMGPPERVVQAGAFLEGLFMSSKSIFMGSPRLLRAINQVLAELDWDTFRILLPDLRRAFTQFIPSEIDQISVKVSEEIGLDEAPSPDEPVPEALQRVSAQADARVTALLDQWI